MFYETTATKEEKKSKEEIKEGANNVDFAHPDRYFYKGMN